MSNIKSYGERWESPCPLERHTEIISEAICFRRTGIEVQASVRSHAGHQLAGDAGQGECGTF